MVVSSDKMLAAYQTLPRDTTRVAGQGPLTCEGLRNSRTRTEAKLKTLVFFAPHPLHEFTTLQLLSSAIISCRLKHTGEVRESDVSA